MNLKIGDMISIFQGLVYAAQGFDSVTSMCASAVLALAQSFTYRNYDGPLNYTEDVQTAISSLNNDFLENF